VKVSVVGAGQVGANTAFEIAKRNLADVALIDVVEGVAEGKALDMAQAAPLVGWSSSIEGASDFSLLENSQVVVVTAGSPRKPGMSRLDLMKKNGQIVQSVVNEVKKRAPQSILMVVTNPLDVMVYLALRVSAFPRHRVLGMGGLLDSSRFRYFIAQQKGLSPSVVKGWVVGAHGDSMVPLFSTVESSQGALAFSLEEKELISKRTRQGGTEIVSYLKSGSASFTPAVCVAQMVEAIAKDKPTLFSTAFLVEGEYGLSGVVLSLPAILDGNGLREVVELPLVREEMEELKASAEKVRQAIDELKKEFSL
jgi:malate dehydrogenase